MSRLVLEGETAFLVMPGRRAYWRADRTEVMTKLLGFDINPEELSALLTGREPGLGGWILEADDRGRIARGRRDGLAFSVQEFFDGGRLPRTVVFADGEFRGSLKVMRLRFNQPAPRGGPAAGIPGGRPLPGRRLARDRDVAQG